MSEAAKAALQQTNFTALDWVIVILYPLLSLGMAGYVGAVPYAADAVE